MNYSCSNTLCKMALAVIEILFIQTSPGLKPCNVSITQQRYTLTLFFFLTRTLAYILGWNQTKETFKPPLCNGLPRLVISINHYIQVPTTTTQFVKFCGMVFSKQLFHNIEPVLLWNKLRYWTIPDQFLFVQVSEICWSSIRRAKSTIPLNLVDFWLFLKNFAKRISLKLAKICSALHKFQEFFMEFGICKRKNFFI